MHIKAIASCWLLLTMSTLVASASAAECRVICSSASNAECLAFSGPAGVARGVSALRAKFAKREQVKKADLMAMFEQSNDPCGRSDTTFAANTFANEGAICRVQSSLKFLTTDLKVSITFPAALKGEILDSGGFLTVKFPDVMKSPFVRIGDEGLDADWGGIVKAMDVSDSTLFILTREKCIRYDFN